MTHADKIAIQTKLDSYVSRYQSQNSAANSLRDVSAATLSQIKNDKWDKIADDMWRNIASQIGIRTWQKVETRCYRLMSEAFDDAQRYSNVCAITAAAGSGKSFAAADYVSTHPNAYHLVCCEWWGLQKFLGEVLRTMGLEAKVTNNDNSVMLADIVAALVKQPTPLLIFDEADKLQDKVLYSFISLYNQIEGLCGIVFCATENLESRIVDGVRLKKRGYNEIYSRLGRRFIAIKSNTTSDVEKVCLANGIDDISQIERIVGDCDLDLRRVKHFVHSQKLINAKTNGTGN